MAKTINRLKQRIIRFDPLCRTALLLCALILLPSLVSAREIGVFPNQAITGQDLIVVFSFSSSGCTGTPTLTESSRIGDTVVMELDDPPCPLLPPCCVDYEFATPITPLPVGDYTLEIRDPAGDFLYESTSFTVFDHNEVASAITAGPFTRQEGEPVYVLVSGTATGSIDLGDINIDSTPSPDGLRLASVSVDIFISSADPPIPRPFTYFLDLGPLPSGKYLIKTTSTENEDLNASSFFEVVPEELGSDILSVSPMQPTAADELTALIRLPGKLLCDPNPVVTGGESEASEVRIEIDAGCIDSSNSESRVTLEASFGPLDAGTYLVGLYDEPGAFIEQVEVSVDEAGGCQPSDTTLCLHRNRFKAKVLWTTEFETQGPGHVQTSIVGPNSSSGAFWFFSPSNVELDVKLIDACGFNGHYWLFAAGLTDVGVELKVEDTVAGGRKVYNNPIGEAFEVIRDVEAFPCSL